MTTRVPSHPLLPLFLAFVFLAVMAVWPAPRPIQRSVKDYEAKQIAGLSKDLQKLRKEKLGTLLAERKARLGTVLNKHKEEFKEGQTRVFDTKPIASQKLSLLTLQAFDSDSNGSYTSITELDHGGDSGVYAIWIDSYNYASRASVWGVVRWNDWDRPDPWISDEGTSIDGYASNGRNFLDKLACRVAPSLLARPDNCYGAWRTAREILRETFTSAFYNFSLAAFGCYGFGLGYGPCLAGTVFVSVAAGIPYYTYDWYWRCRVLD